MNRVADFVRLLAICISLALTTSSRGQALTTSNLFPDPAGFYQCANNIPFEKGETFYFLTDLRLSNPTNSVAPPTDGGAHTVNLFFDVYVRIQPPEGPDWVGSMTVPCQISITDIDDEPPFHEYFIEMLELELSGGGLPDDIMLRESPSQESSNPHLVEDREHLPDVDYPGYYIESSMELHTELTLDGGLTWSPSQGTTQIVNAPEPAACGILAMSIMLTSRRRAFRLQCAHAEARRVRR